MNKTISKKKLEEILAREYDVICVNAPATSQNKVELPGEPVLMQYALSLTLDKVRQTREAIIQGNGKEHYSYFPRTGDFDEKTGEFGKSDGILYDPRIWDAQAKAEFQDRLDSRNYKFALFTTLSQSHPYALEMARMVKAKNPDTIVVFGGNHQSETITNQRLCRVGQPETNAISVGKHNTLSQILGGRTNDVVDFVVGGQGEFSIDYLMKSAGDIISSGVKLNPVNLKDKIKTDSRNIEQLPGDFTFACIEAGKISTYRSSGKKTDILEMPDHTDFFTLKTVNRTLRAYQQGWNREAPKSQEEDNPTSHLISKDKCIMRCAFCSEVANGNSINKEDFDTSELRESLKKKLGDSCLERLTSGIQHYGTAEAFYLRTINAVANGAGSLFDDTSTHFSGDFEQMQRYASLMKSAKVSVSREEDDFSKRLKEFHYAYQLTIGQILQMEKQKPELMRNIIESGGEYLYVGLESMADEVLNGIHKYAVIKDERFQKKEDAIEHALRYVKSQSSEGRTANIGTSVLFGLKGETLQTIDYTITRVGELVRDELIDLVSPNIYTFHPKSTLGANLQRTYGFEPNYTEIVNVKYPFTYFEEVNPRNFSPLISHRDLLKIVERTETEWKSVNKNRVHQTESIDSYGNHIEDNYSNGGN